ncbi:type III polyketide synthase [Flavobacterium gawalongense]|uniref:Type III polyketide synthase n=1 Tax=Flavobacterium gawalongense TaxID=2594432 RepID=A0A553BES5_9FLAO|nr:type III polyketide synthase [Flavobacterium gawalongense]TRW99099.1 type III polyketide synthase [Flavobacterium gawalongense]TRX03820.1 type III polyketide synthase [Flavobacterium gawalongense]TRX06740.1 type III polyketide synthase [Flavobacterium gawalongense]TRX07604.1 type III polyketide synthase [Flavobacterium gawalongense]TRX23433.1 type III polyketide synthase [Flavobacterium gawalongense]
MSVKIKTVTKQLPKYSRTTEEIIPFLDAWLVGQEERFIRKVKKIFEGAAVDKRYSIMDPIAVFTKTSFEERNNIYVREVIDLGEKVLEKALKKANWNPEDLDYIITVSCTGIMIPSLDAYLINKLKLRQDIVRLPVTEMGCVAGISGIIYAKNFLQANPGKRAAVIAVESPTATFQLDDFSMANIVSAAIFGDGAACVLLSSHQDEEGPEILAEEMYHFYDNIQMMGFKLTNSGLQMVLDIEVPETIASHFPDIIHPFLEKNNLTIDTIDHLIFHPGGKKIVQTVETLFSDLEKNIDDTKEVLRLYGNMSSATVLYVLERIMDSKPKKGEKGLMLSFGPGFSAQRVLLQF